MKLLPLFVFVGFLILALSQKVKRHLKWQIALPIHLVIVFLSLGSVYKFSFNEWQKNKIIINKLASEERWNDLLKTAKKIDLTADRRVQFQVNRALYHTGSLLEKMFTYPQYFGIDGLFLDRKTSGGMAILTSDLYYDLSFCNGARHWANEAANIFGLLPRIIKRLVTCYIINGQVELASKYLSLIEKSDQYKDWAERMRKYLDSRTCVESNAEFVEFLQNRNFPDEFETIEFPRTNLSLLTAASSKNKMAIEYSVAYDLLKHDIKTIITDLKLLKEAGYTELPRYVQEALLIYMVKEKNFRIDLQGFKIDLEVQKDFNSFNRIFASVKGDKMQAKSLHQQFKNTYWYYNIYKSPITNGRELKTKS